MVENISMAMGKNDPIIGRASSLLMNGAVMTLKTRPMDKACFSMLSVNAPRESAVHMGRKRR